MSVFLSTTETPQHAERGLFIDRTHYCRISKQLALSMMLGLMLFSGPASARVWGVNAYDSGTMGNFGPGGPGSEPLEYTGALWVSRIGFSSVGFRNYFKFDVSRIDSEVEEAFLVLEFPTGAYESTRGAETFELYGVWTDPADFGFDFSSCTTHAATWSEWGDLGRGAFYGSRSYTEADEGTITRIPLSEDALRDINTAITADGEFAIGGRLQIPETLALPTGYADWIFDATLGSSAGADLCFGPPETWTVRRLELHTAD